MQRHDQPLTHRTATEPLDPGVITLPATDVGRAADWQFYETYQALPERDEQDAGTYVVVDTINFSTTISWLLDRGVGAVTPLRDEAAAEAFADRTPEALVGGDYTHDDPGRGDLKNSPSDCAEADRDWADTHVGLQSINGANAVCAVREDADCVVASPVNAEAVARWLDGDDEPIHFVAAGTRGTQAVEDTFGIYRVVDHLLGASSTVTDALDLRMLDHVYATSSHLNNPPDLHPDQHVIRAFDSLDVVPVRDESGRLVDAS
ncbi:2-phosphosulfolactate phosphatase [Halomarina salina]|uniref:2-phosphosulfolactate phosphatase n=1 Tax=Halomarina salina TaxID=1872699 RepID=A0ABD5RKS7_9EURY